jgi:Transposase DDE domain group 1
VATNGIRLVRPRTVTADGDGLVTHAGVVWLGEVADRSGLTSGLCRATRRLARRRHDPGVTLAQMIVALADGATCVSDLAALRDQPALFGPAASHPTTWRTFANFGPAEFRDLAAARAEARAAAWAAGAGPAADEAIVDVDATLIRTRADKQDARPTYKRTYGHHPLLAMIAETGEVLTGMLRPGNAGANCAEDHVVVLEAAIAQLPIDWQAGHQPGDAPASVQKRLTIRADAAGASHWFAEECRDRNLEYSLGYWIDDRVRDALLLTQEEAWKRAVEPGGKIRDGAEVAELTELVNLDGWPDRTRLIVRREDPHPGAQLSLFDTVEGKRHTAFITDTTGDIAELELRHRQRARAETVIRDTKACGLTNLPFDGVANNGLWMHLCFAANDLLAWGRRISLDSAMRRATPKTIRYRLLHTAARTSTGHLRLHLDRNWPWSTTLTDAIDRLRRHLTPLDQPLRPGVHPGL